MAGGNIALNAITNSSAKQCRNNLSARIYTHFGTSLSKQKLLTCGDVDKKEATIQLLNTKMMKW
jgi:hypothetical protein